MGLSGPAVLFPSPGGAVLNRYLWEGRGQGGVWAAATSREVELSSFLSLRRSAITALLCCTVVEPSLRAHCPPSSPGTSHWAVGAFVLGAVLAGVWLVWCSEPWPSRQRSQPR